MAAIFPRTLAAAMGLAILSGSALVAAEGEKISRDYDEAALDAAYSQGNWADNIGEVYDRLVAILDTG